MSICDFADFRIRSGKIEPLFWMGDLVHRRPPGVALVGGRPLGVDDLLGRLGTLRAAGGRHDQRDRDHRGYRDRGEQLHALSAAQPPC